MISPVQLPSFASIKPPSSLMIHQHLLHQHTTLIHFEAVTLVTPKQKVKKKPQNLNKISKAFFFKKPPVLPSIVLASKAKLTLLSSPQGSAVMARILMIISLYISW